MAVLSVLVSDHATVALPFFVYLGLLALSPLVPLSVAVAGRLGRSRRHTLAAWVVVPAALALLAGLGLLTLSARLAFEISGSVLLGLLVLWGFPLAVALRLLGSRGVQADHAASLAAAGLPVGLVASFLVFLAPGGFYRYNITFLTGPAAWLAWTAFFGAVLLIPAVVALALERRGVGRLVTRRAR